MLQINIIWNLLMISLPKYKEMEMNFLTHLTLNILTYLFQQTSLAVNKQALSQKPLLVVTGTNLMSLKL